MAKGGKLDLAKVSDEEYAKFEETLRSVAPEFWKRRRAADLIERSISPREWSLTDQVVRRLYYEAKTCYVAGAYLGSVVMARAAVERLLRAWLGWREDDRRDVVLAASDAGIIPRGMAEEVRFVRRLVQNPAAHGYDIMVESLSITSSDDVDGVRGAQVSTGVEGKTVVDLDRASHYAMMLLFTLVRIGPGGDWSRWRPGL